MIINNSFEVVEVGGEYLMIPIGEMASSFHGVIVLSEPMAYLLKNSTRSFSVDDWVALLMSKYEINKLNAARDIGDILPKLIELQVVETE